jgi:hypothetical protein
VRKIFFAVGFVFLSLIVLATIYVTRDTEEAREPIERVMSADQTGRGIVTYRDNRFQGVYFLYIDYDTNGSVDQIKLVNIGSKMELTIEFEESWETADKKFASVSDTMKLFYYPDFYFSSESESKKIWDANYRKVVRLFKEKHPEMDLLELRE